MKDKSVLVTGSTDDIGKQTAIDLVKMGASVLIHGRDQGRFERTVKEIKNAAGNDSFISMWIKEKREQQV